MITVVCHVNDLKVSQKEPFESKNFATYLSIIYGNTMKVHRWKVYGHLGMYLDYSEPGVVKVSTIKYLQKVLESLPEN